MADLTAIFGLLGSITAATLFLPQVWKAYKSRKTKDLSWMTIIIGMMNGIFWVAYGLLKTDPFIYVTNSVLLSATVSLALLKNRYD